MSDLREKIEDIIEYQGVGGTDQIIALCMDEAIEAVRSAVSKYGANSVSYIHAGDDDVKDEKEGEGTLHAAGEVH